MTKIQFDVKYRPQIESGEYKVETEDGFPATIWDWSFHKDSGLPYICAKITRDGRDDAFLYSQDGKRAVIANRCGTNLVIITPEPEMSEFETEVYKMVTGEKDLKDIKEQASRLLDLARKEIEKEHKSAEWSEEDLQHKSWILECLADGERKMPEYAEDFRTAYKWLKCLRHSWKPSKEQMNVLRGVIAYLCKIRIDDDYLMVLQNLYNDLLKQI